MVQEIQITFSLTADAKLSKEEIVNLMNKLINENTANSTTYERLVIPRIDVSQVKEEHEIYNLTNIETACKLLVDGTKLVLKKPEDYDKSGNGEYTKDTIFLVEKVLSNGLIDLFNEENGDVLLDVELSEVKPYTNE